jgi:hypothetical protein
MNKHFIQVTNGMLPVAVLVLLAVAFVAGQARATSPIGGAHAGNTGSNPAGEFVLDVELAPAAETAERRSERVDSLPRSIRLPIGLPREVSLPDFGGQPRRGKY